MKHPIFSLSTKPDCHVRRYEHGEIFVEVKPSVDGLAAVHDRDVLIYCISQVMAALNEGREVSPLLRFRAHDLLKATTRMTNGNGYGLRLASGCSAAQSLMNCVLLILRFALLEVPWVKGFLH